MNIDKLINHHSLVSDQVSKSEIKIILTELNCVLNRKISGDVVEFGCYKGTTSLFLMRLLMGLKSRKKLFLYDSFDGLPDKTEEDKAGLGQEFKRGELRATKREVVENFKRAGLTLPIIKKAWFSDLTSRDVPSEIAFAYFDGDFYGSIHDSFAACNERFMSGATIVVDDYGNDHLPGAARAVDEWVATHRKQIAGKVRLQDSLAIIHLK